MKHVSVDRLMEVVSLECPPPINIEVGLSHPPPLNINRGSHLSRGWASINRGSTLVCPPPLILGHSRKIFYVIVQVCVFKWGVVTQTYVTKLVNEWYQDRGWAIIGDVRSRSVIFVPRLVKHWTSLSPEWCQLMVHRMVNAVGGAQYISQAHPHQLRRMGNAHEGVGLGLGSMTCGGNRHQGWSPGSVHDGGHPLIIVIRVRQDPR